MLVIVPSHRVETSYVVLHRVVFMWASAVRCAAVDRAGSSEPDSVSSTRSRGSRALAEDGGFRPCVLTIHFERSMSDAPSLHPEKRSVRVRPPSRPVPALAEMSSDRS